VVDRTPLRLFLTAERPTSEEIARLLLEAADSAEREILRLAGREGIGAEVRRAQLTIAARNLRREAVQMWSVVEQSIRDGIARSAKAAAEAQNLLTAVVFRSAGLTEPALLSSALIRQAEQSAKALESRRLFAHTLSQRVYSASVQANGFVQAAINRALGRGATWKELANDVRRLISPNTPGGVSYAAKRLGRTELNNAFHTTQVRFAQKNPFITGERWVLSGSHPRPDVCNDYADRNGGVFEKQDVPGKPHPQCLCYLVAVTPSKEEFFRKYQAGEYDSYIADLQGSTALPEKLIGERVKGSKALGRP
jgi:hypothetical protein